MEFYIAQGITILTALTVIISMQTTSMKWILLGQILANLFSASTYFLLGGFSGAGICLLAILQAIVMFFYERAGKTPHLAIIIGFIVLYIACSIVYYKTLIDVFSAIAAVCYAISITQKSPTNARLWYVFNPICWLIYSLFTRAYANVIMYVCIFVSTAFTLVRVDKIFARKQATEENSEQPIEDETEVSLPENDA
jgi:hypothetical protein